MIIEISRSFPCCAKNINLKIEKGDKKTNKFWEISIRGRIYKAYPVGSNKFFLERTEKIIEEYRELGWFFLKPYILEVEITKECNCRCIHCCGDYPDNKYISVSDFRRILRENEFGEIILSGGEPTIHPDFSKIVSLAKRHALKVTTVTNGTIFSEALLECDKIIVSIYGEKKTHEKVTGVKGSYSRTLRNLRKIASNSNIEIEINLVLIKGINDNPNDIESVFKLSKALRAKVNVGFVLPIGRGKKLEKPQDSIGKIINDLKKKYSIVCRSPWEERVEGSLFGCIAGRMMVFVDAKFNVKPCRFVNIRKRGNIMDVWFSREFMRIREPCSNCDLKYICGGRCKWRLRS